MSKETDDVVDIQVKIELKKNGRIVQLNGKLKELAESFQEKMKKEIRKEDVVFEE